MPDTVLCLLSFLVSICSGFIVIDNVLGEEGKELAWTGLVRDHVKNEEALLLEGRVLSNKEKEDGKKSRPDITCKDEIPFERKTS
jgi:hypothetical protein